MWEGALIAVFANFLVSLSLTVQKLAHIKNEAATEAARANVASLDPKDRTDAAIAAKGYWQLPWWWLGVAIDAVGEFGNLIAYGYAPTFVVAPLGATTVMFNSIFAVVILKERFRRQDAACLLAILVGIVLIVYSNDGEEHMPLTVDATISNFFNTWQCITLVSVSLTAIACLQLYIHLRRTSITSMFPYLWTASLISMYTVLCSKAAVMWMRAPEAGHSTQLPYALLWIMLALVVVTAVWSMHYLQMALQAFESSHTVPTLFTLFTLCCVVGAALVFQEFKALSPLTMALFIIGLSLSILGVFLLARRGSFIPETAITQLLHRGLAASPTVRRCQTSGGRIFAETSDAVLSPRLVYQQDLEAGNGTHSPSPTGDEQDPKKGLSFAEALLMQENVSKSQILEHLRCTDSADSFFARRPSADLSHNGTRSSSPVQKGNTMTQALVGLRSPSRLYKGAPAPQALAVPPRFALPPPMNTEAEGQADVRAPETAQSLGTFAHPKKLRATLSEKETADAAPASADAAAPAVHAPGVADAS